MIRYFIPLLFGSLLFGQVTSIPAASGGGGGGVNVPSGTSGGIPCYTAASTIASSSALTSNAVVKGGGAGACPTASGVTVDSSNNVVVPGNITTGTSGGGSVLISGASSGTQTVAVPSTFTSNTYTFPGGSDTFLGQNLRHSYPAGAISGTLPASKTAYANLASGDNDIITAGASERVLILGVSFYNTTAGNLANIINLKRSGTYYRLSQVTVLANSAGNNYTSIVLAPNDIFAINAAGTGMNAIVRYIRYSSSFPLYSPILLALSSGDNTLYTVPANTTAYLFSVSSANPIGYSLNLLVPGYSNTSTASRTITWNLVPSGGSVASTNQISAATSISNNSQFSTTVLPGVMNTGDFLSINTSAATSTQVAWTIVYESPY